MVKKNIVSKSDSTALKLAILAKEKESVRKKLAIAAQKLATTAEQKESVRHELAITAEEKEDVRSKLAVTAKQLDVAAKEKEIVRKKLVVTAEQLADTAKEKEGAGYELLEHAKKLEQNRSAMLNILEDLQVEKGKLADAKVKEEAILSSIGEGIIATGPDREIIVMNRMAEELLGWKIDEAIGKLYTDVVSLEDEKGVVVPLEERPLTKAFGGHTTTTTTTGLFLISKNKIKFPVAITVSPIILNNQIIGAVEVLRDITKEKEIEKLRADFLSLASHQLRTPLSGTKWLIETMQKGLTGKIESKEKEYLDALYQMNDRMIKLVFDMLSVLRLESGSEAIKKEVISILGLYEDLISAMTAPAKSKWVVLKNALKNNTKIEVETDVQLLKTILECFISNAINYTPPGKAVFLDVKEEKNTVIFSVKDNGIGIPEEEQSKIFERFYRASNAKLLKPEGTGLGLYIAKMLAEKIGGKVYFESPASPAKRGEKNGKGAAFFLSIPKKAV